MPDRDPTPREEAALRRLLRDARHDGPVPPEVAARTEQTLASLGAAHEPAPTGTTPTEAARTGTATTGTAARGGADHHRRRRAATALLVAAVSVVVVGIGLGQVLRPASDQASGSAQSDSAGSAARDTPPDRAGADQENAPERSAAADTLSELARRDGAARAFGGGLAVERLALVADPPAVRETRFARDVRRVRALQQAERRERSSSALGDGSELAPRDPAPGFTCARTDLGAGRPVAVRYQEAPAVLLLRPPTRATQVADLVECGTGEVVRSVTLPR
ncbi:hypothetical protein [Nocardioides sp. AX2bis]|uniref:hypothetical protein n=1 Tax=Nocardioides sp. AX2bis TaxID=2653157 RepID=UPI0012F21AFF|nr:hypothetical protein [Nocardioides sp. AX2bis]VXA91805.1 conserved hypothetical protein [Nocardioides sp. AX2bis]